MEPRIYKETARRLWFHFAVGAVLVAVPVPLGLRGFFGLMFIVGLPVLLLALWSLFRHLVGLSEYVRVSGTGVEYVDPLRKERSIILAAGDIRSARYEEKKFGITGRKKEMCAVVAVTGGKKLTLTERFLAPDLLKELVDQVTLLIQEGGEADRACADGGPGGETGPAGTGEEQAQMEEMDGGDSAGEGGSRDP